MEDCKKYKLSIIIPHYESFNFLRKCLDSIPDLDGVEIIVIDDNSPNWDLYCNDLKVDYPNVIFEILSDNKGAGAARNRGLELAAGEWLMFADADDYFEPFAFDVILKYCADDADIIYFKTDSYDVVSKTQSDRHIVINQYIDEYLIHAKMSEENLRFRSYGPVAKMIRKKMVLSHNIKFDEVRYSNDVMFSARIGYYASSIIAVDSIVYCITTSSNSLSRSMNKESLLCRYKIAVNYNRFLKEVGYECCQTMILRYFALGLKYAPSCLIPMFKIAIREKINFFAGIRRWRQIFLKHKRQLSHF